MVKSSGSRSRMPVDEGSRSQRVGPVEIEEALQQHEALIHAFIRRQEVRAISYEEALQAGRIGLWRALLGYDATRGTAFSTYAWVAICRQIHQAVAELDRAVDDWPEGVCLLWQAPLDPVNLQRPLPLVLPRHPTVPPSLKPRYRSAYRNLGYGDLEDVALLETLSSFELAVRLFDYSHRDKCLSIR